MSQIQDITVRFSGTANFSQVQKQIQALQLEFTRLAGSMEAARVAADKQSRPDLYNQQMKAVQQLRTEYNSVAQASGEFHVQTVKTISSSQALTEGIIKQKIGWKQAKQELLAYKSGGTSALREMIKEQTALQKSMATQWTSNAFGKNTTDMLVPKSLGTELENARVKYGTINRLLGSAATQTINWGKNTQWAGRQIMVGITVPLAIAAGGAAAMAMKVDQEMTRVTKVYDTTAKTAAGQDKELGKVREQSFALASQAANQYGMAVKDTLDIEAQLAQTGLNGINLYTATNQAARVATLGEMDYQKAVDMTISLQTAYKIKNQDLAKSFDFMNAVENATSLSIQDIADAIPRAGSALASMGVNVQQTTIMLGAMKEAGVNATEAANALKSGAATILRPTPAAQNFWFKELGVNLPKILKDAKGNIYDFMTELAKASHGLDPSMVEKGVALLFGKFQFNRETALIKNLGDAMTGTANQTAKIMQIAGQSSAQWAQTSETELSRWQNSTQGKFKRAIEGLKASMIPFGTAVLGAVTPLLGVIQKIIDGFNNLSPAIKTGLGGIAVLMAVAGPALMLVGIFGNLFGNLMKFGTVLFGMANKFKPLTIEQAAAEITAKNAASAFNTEAGRAAILATSIRDLTAAMEAQAVASGHMMSSTGVLVNRDANGVPLVGSTRKVIRRDNNAIAYDKGSYDAAGNPIGGRIISPNHPDAQMLIAQEKATAGMAVNAEKTKVSMAGAGRAAGMLGAGALAVMTMKSGASSTLDTMLNVAMVVGTISMMFPGMFTKGLTSIKGIGSALAMAVSGPAITGSVNRLWTAFRVNGMRGTLGVTGQIAQMAPRFASFASAALRVFGPVGLLAAGVLALKAMHDHFTTLSNDQEKLNESSKAFAAVFNVQAKSSLPEAEKSDNVVTATKARGAALDALKSQYKDLSSALEGANGNMDKAYETARNVALRFAADTNATSDQVRQAFEVAMQGAGATPSQIKNYRVKFDQIKIDNPQEVAQALSDDISQAMKDARSHLTPQGFGESFDAQIFGGGEGASDAAKAAAKKTGASFVSALQAAVTPQDKAKVGSDLSKSLNDTYAGALEHTLGNDPKIKADMKKLGINTMAQLADAMDRSDKDLGNKALQNLFRDVTDNNNASTALQSYRDVMTSMLDSIGKSLGYSGKGLDTWKSKIKDIPGLLNDLGIPTMTVAEATAEYNKRVLEAAAGGKQLSEAEDLKLLNIERAKAGLSAATDVTQGFANTTAAATSAIKQFANAADSMTVTADQMSSAQKTAMSGAWNDVLTEAGRQYDVQRQQTIDAVKARYDAINNGLDAEAKAQSRSYDARGKAMSKAQDAATKSATNYWKGREDAVNKAMDAMKKSDDIRKQALQDQIDAEQKADEIRQKIFEAEKQRIDRMATLANDKISFNIALNSGNLDEAARLSVSQSAQQSTWNADDQQALLGDASKKHQDALKSQIDAIDAKEKKAEEASKATIDRIQKERDAALESLKARQDAETEALAAQKQRDADGLEARRAANQKAAASAQKAAQDAADADKRSLDQRLRALQQFVPTNEAELRAHIKDVQSLYADYGVNLKMQGNAWSTYIGDALKNNINSAAAGLQSEIGWQKVAANISSQMGAGMGMSLGQVKTFLSTGTWPAGAQVITPAYTAKPLKGSLGGTTHIAMGPGGAGGITRHAGGPADYSQADRVGIPRNATPYHSEVVALLKRGEFVVNERATSKHGELLHAINSGAMDNIGTVKHAGGLVDMMQALTAMQMTAVAETAVLAAQEKARRAYATQADGLGGDGGYSSGMTWPALDRLRAQLFPGSVLTSSLRPGANDWHGAGDAIDIGWPGNTQAGLMPIAARLAALYPNATELIHNPNGSIKNGQPVPPSFWGAATWSQHANHVHWAMTPEALASHHAALGAAMATGTNQRIVQSMAAARGWTGAEWNALYQLVNRESGFRNTAQNPTSTAYGMFQFLNSTWGRNTKTSDPAQQTRLGLDYIGSRYGDPIAAWNHEVSAGWYDRGGYLKPGQLGLNLSKTAEPVFSGEQWAILRNSLANSTLMYENLTKQANLVPSVAGGPGVASGDNSHYTVNVDLRGAMVKEDVDLEKAIFSALDKRESRNGRRRVIS